MCGGAPVSCTMGHTVCLDDELAKVSVSLIKQHTPIFGSSFPSDLSTNEHNTRKVWDYFAVTLG